MQRNKVYLKLFSPIQETQNFPYRFALNYAILGPPFEKLVFAIHS